MGWAMPKKIFIAVLLTAAYCCGVGCSGKSRAVAPPPHKKPVPSTRLDADGKQEQASPESSSAKPIASRKGAESRVDAGESVAPTRDAVEQKDGPGTGQLTIAIKEKKPFRIRVVCEDGSSPCAPGRKQRVNRLMEGTLEVEITNNTGKFRSCYQPLVHGVKFVNARTGRIGVLSHICDWYDLMNYRFQFRPFTRPLWNERHVGLEPGEKARFEIGDSWYCDGDSFTEHGNADILRGGTFWVSYRMTDFETLVSHLEDSYVEKYKNAPNILENDWLLTAKRLAAFLPQEQVWAGAVESTPIMVEVTVEK
jgi:hypothetical protein